VANFEETVKALVGLDEADLNIVVSLASKLKEISKIGPNDKPTDAELYWLDMVGDNQWTHDATQGLWTELASIQMNPTANFKRIQQIKLRLRAMGEL